MDFLKKQTVLLRIAEQDNAYVVWKKTYEECTKQFEDYAYAQPEEIRDILWGYAAGGRLMNQRLVNLACEHMAFTDPGENE